jgi:hypothetical protein
MGTLYYFVVQFLLESGQREYLIVADNLKLAEKELHSHIFYDTYTIVKKGESNRKFFLIA